MQDAPSLSDEADPLYRPLPPLARWTAARVDHAAWDGAVERIRRLRAEDPDWGDMVARGALLAAAYRSGALDGLYDADHEATLALVHGETLPATLAEPVGDHVRANYDALCLAAGSGVSDASIRRIHEVASRPQLTHRVRVGEVLQDHVLGGGEYKHHPNHVLGADGRWQPTAPVAVVRAEMARVVEAATSATFGAVHPVARAAYLHDALLHVQPFADGNGRVARALAGACLLGAAGVPLLAVEPGGAGVGPVERAVVALVDLLAGPGPPGALHDWRRRAEGGRALRAALVPAVERALARHQTNRWGADLSAATVTAGDEVTIVVPGTVAERLTVDAHPLDGGPVAVVARKARLRHDTGSNGLDAWLDRVVSTLALRVAAELE